MPTVSFPLTYLQRLTPIAPTDLMRLAFDYGLEANLQGEALVVEVTAERPDLLAAEGFTRALNIYQGQQLTRVTTLSDSGRQVTVDPAVFPIRPHLAALVVRQADLGDGGLEVLVQFQEKVTQTFGRQRRKIAIGVYDLSQVVGNLTYRALPVEQVCFIPLHSPGPMTAGQILTQHPAGQLYGQTLAGHAQVPVLQDEQGTVLSLPPIINAAGVGEVTATTTDLLIDVTGVLAQTVMETLNILAHNFLDTGAEVQTVTIQHPTGSLVTPALERRPVTFSPRFLNEIIGTAIPKGQLGPILARMDLEVSGTDQVYVPTYRTDVLSQVDIAGDLLVALGMESLQAEPLAVKFHLGQAAPLPQLGLRLGDLAQRLGLMEVKSYILTDPGLLAHFGYPYLQTSNAKSRTHSATRPTLLAGLLDILSRNINLPKPINIYEIGEVVQDVEPNQVRERLHWGFASLDARASFSTAKAYLQTLLRALGFDYTLTTGEAPYYIPGRSARILVRGEPVGEFGEIHPALLNAFSFPEPVCAGELDCHTLARLIGQNHGEAIANASPL
jgi:phenylalanyl-tRNA synthetase beta chain